MNCSVCLILPAAPCPGVYSASKYQKQKKKSSWGIKRGRNVSFTTIPPSVSRLSRQCAIQNKPIGLHGLLRVWAPSHERQSAGVGIQGNAS
jgi:hypothetical protein